LTFLTAEKLQSVAPRPSRLQTDNSRRRYRQEPSSSRTRSLCRSRFVADDIYRRRTRRWNLPQHRKLFSFLAFSEPVRKGLFVWGRRKGLRGWSNGFPGQLPSLQQCTRPHAKSADARPQVVPVPPRSKRRPAGACWRRGAIQLGVSFLDRPGRLESGVGAWACSETPIIRRRKS
jgi:hypothetical protein